MRPSLFSITEAKYFCKNFASTSGISEASPEDFIISQLGNKKTACVEGSQDFVNLRDCILREAERALFLAISHYRRSLDLMVSSSAHWLHVTLYYGTWYSAHAFLLMFGCYKDTKNIIDVKRGNPGKQELQNWKIGRKNGQFQVPGSNYSPHRSFWNIFYEAVTPLRRIVDQKLSPCLYPISSDNNWLINKRNNVNYKTTESIDVIFKFQDSFSEEKFPNCLSGDLSTQYTIFEYLLKLTSYFAKDFNIYNDSLDKLMPNSNFTEKIRDLIYERRAPDLIKKIKNSDFF